MALRIALYIMMFILFATVMIYIIGLVSLHATKSDIYRISSVHHRTKINDKLDNDEEYRIGKFLYGLSDEKVFKYCFKNNTRKTIKPISWIIQPKQCNKDDTIVLLIKSSVYRNSLRQAVRKTWAQQLNDSELGSIKRIFIVGSAQRVNSAITLLEKESEVEQDILQGSFPDTFRSVSQKVITGMRFVKLYCPKVKLIIVADDDSIILPWNLFRYLNLGSKMKHIPQAFFGGFFWYGMPIIRDPNSIYYVSENDYNCTTYPPYPSGAVYALSYQTMASFYHLVQTFKYVYTDDVVFGVMAQITKVKLSEFPWHRLSMDPYRLFQLHSTSYLSHLWACHGVDYAADQIRMWTEFCFTETTDAETARLNLAYCSKMLEKSHDANLL